MKFISMDLETTGLDSDRDLVVEIAAGVSQVRPLSFFKGDMDRKATERLKLLPAGDELRKAISDYVYAPLENPIRILVMPDKEITARLEVLAMHSDLWVELDTYREAMRQKEVIKLDESFYVVRREKAYPIFRGWFKRVWSDDGMANVAGKNFAGFDARFLRRLDPQFDGLFRPRVIDPAVLYYRDGDEKTPSTENCLERLREKWPEMPGMKQHRAMDDATAVAWLVKAALYERGGLK